MPHISIGIAICFAFVWFVGVSAMVRAVETKIPVTFSGGHDIAKNDYGRPIALDGGRALV